MTYRSKWKLPNGKFYYIDSKEPFWSKPRYTGEKLVDDDVVPIVSQHYKSVEDWLFWEENLVEDKDEKLFD